MQTTSFSTYFSSFKTQIANNQPIQKMMRCLLENALTDFTNFGHMLFRLSRLNPESFVVKSLNRF